MLNKNWITVLGSERFSESQKSLRWDRENLRERQGRQLCVVDGPLFLKPLEQPGIKVKDAGWLNPSRVPLDRLSAVVPVVVVGLVADGACQGVTDLLRRPAPSGGPAAG